MLTPRETALLAMLPATAETLMAAMGVGKHRIAQIIYDIRRKGIRVTWETGRVYRLTPLTKCIVL
jgi:biotin operon repressor